MFTKNKFKTQLNGLYKNNNNSNELPISFYVSSTHETPACSLYISETFKADILDFLLR